MKSTDSKNEGNGGGKAFAHLFSTGSRALKLVPPLDRLIVGDNAIPAGWRYAERVGCADAAGITFEGDPNGTRLPIPRLYKQAGILAVQAGEMNGWRARHPDALHAVALAFGRALVVGAFEPGVQFAPVIEDEQKLELVGVRVGRGDVTALPGLWLPDSERFIPAVHPQLHSQVAIGSVPKEVPIA